MNDGRDEHLAMVQQLAARRECLPPNSHVRAAIPDELLKELQDKIHAAPDVGALDHSKWPMIFGFVESATDEAIRELDGDIDLVLGTTAVARRASVTRFLTTRATDHPSRWYGGLFEVWAKATLLREATAVEFDVRLPNGRDRDVVAEIGNQRAASSRLVSFECTVITEDDESREVWDRFIQDKKTGSSKPLIRPGPYDPPNAKGPSPYYMPLRLYGKFFDKITKDLDPDRSQCAVDQPNILVCPPNCLPLKLT